MLIFGVRMKNGLLYSLCWEDPDIFRSLVNAGDEVLTVASAGDIALSCLTRLPNSVDAIDTNADQLNLGEFKKSCFGNLDYQHCHKMLGTFGETAVVEGVVSTMETIDVRLDLATDQNAPLLYQGRFERYMRSFVCYVLPLAVDKSVIREFLDASSLQEQSSIYHNKVNNWRYRLLFKWFFGRFVMKRWGRHPDLLKHVKQAIASTYFKRLAHAWTQVPIADNYFFRIILMGYLTQNLPLPLWAQPVNHDLIQAGVGRLTFHHSEMMTWLDGTSKRYDCFNLSDICDTMTEEEAGQLFEMCRLRANPGARLLLWNNMVDRRPSKGWIYLEDLSSQHWNQRKVSFYGALGIYELAVE